MRSSGGSCASSSRPTRNSREINRTRARAPRTGRTGTSTTRGNCCCACFVGSSPTSPQPNERCSRGCTGPRRRRRWDVAWERGWMRSWRWRLRSPACAAAERQRRDRAGASPPTSERGDVRAVSGRLAVAAARRADEPAAAVRPIRSGARSPANVQLLRTSRLTGITPTRRESSARLEASQVKFPQRGASSGSTADPARTPPSVRGCGGLANLSSLTRRRGGDRGGDPELGGEDEPSRTRQALARLRRGHTPARRRACAGLHMPRGAASCGKIT